MNVFIETEKENERFLMQGGMSVNSRTHTHSQSWAISLLCLSVSARAADHTPFQTPASCLATALHIDGNAIKSHSKEKRKSGDGGNFDSIRICLERSHVHPQFTSGFHQC